MAKLDFAELDAWLEKAKFELSDALEPADIACSGTDACVDLVNEFHAKISNTQLQRVCQMPELSADDVLYRAADALRNRWAVELLQHIKSEDRRYLRAHLLVEELGELLMAMCQRDEVEVLDALADLKYVTDGTAATFDLPLGDAFVEVHRSNMTKERQPDDPHGERVQAKGPNYRVPDLAEVLHCYRLQQLLPHMIGGTVRDRIADATGDCVNCGMSVKDIFKQIDETGRACCKGGSGSGPRT